MTPPFPPDISTPSARQQLDRILASAVFTNADRLSRFLKFVAEQALEGRADDIKEYLIGIEVFDRASSYDPRIDPVVRVEARRLRLKLQEYYATPGQQDPLIIEIPKGSYVPVFYKRPPRDVAQTQPTKRRPWLWTTVALIALVLMAAMIYRMNLSGPHDAAYSSIAVLPFLNLGGTQESEYFTDGFVEQLTTALAQMEGIRVVARTSAFQFRGRSPDIRVAGQQLGVETVLEGSVWINGEKVRITAQLIKVADGFHLWSQTYERSVKDVFALQEEVTRAIARALKVQFSDGKYPLERSSPPDIQAYSLFLKGQYFKNRLTLEDLTKSIHYLEESIRTDPGYAPAYAALADANATIAFREVEPDAGIVARAKADAVKALELDGRLAEAHAVLAWIRFFYDWDWTESEVEFRRALELNPNSARTHDWYSQSLMCARRFNEAESEAKKALVLDPLNPKVGTTLSIIYYCGHRYDEAIRQARLALEIDPHFFLANTVVGASYQEKQMFPEAAAALRSSLQEYSGDPDTAAHFAAVEARSGKKNEVPELIRLLENPSKSEPKAYYQLAYLYSTLGDNTRAFEALEKAYGQRTSDMPFLNVDPVFDPLHSDARFHVLQKKMRWISPAEQRDKGSKQ